MDANAIKSPAHRIAATKSELLTLEEQLDAAIAGLQPKQPKQPKRSRWTPGNSLADRVFDAIAKKPNEEWTPEKIARAVGCSVPQVWNAASVLVAGGFMVRKSKGVYMYKFKAPQTVSA